MRETVEAACERGGTSIYSTGSSPGFITEAVPLALVSIQSHLENLAIHEYADLSERDSPGLLFDVMGYGKDPAKFESHGRAAHGVAAFGPSLRLTAEALGAPLDSIEGTGGVAAASRTVDIAAGRIEKGTVAAQRMTIHGMHAGRPLLTFSATWYCTTQLDADWDLRPTGWRVVVDGDAPLDIEMPFPVSLERWARRRPATPPTGPSTPCRSCAMHHRASAPRSTCPTSSPASPATLRTVCRVGDLRGASAPAVVGAGLPSHLRREHSPGPGDRRARRQ